ncbi:hypothetical protein AMECASPLE_006453 [Ameca splendens]|uniref:Uncharacterized protein n=1 Tax=Ameca splendens TaxID=208324 RepID=A0ABV0YAV2_9TELE
MSCFVSVEHSCKDSIFISVFTQQHRVYTRPGFNYAMSNSLSDKVPAALHSVLAQPGLNILFPIVQNTRAVQTHYKQEVHKVTQWCSRTNPEHQQDQGSDSGLQEVQED